MLEGFSLQVEALPTQTRTRRHGKRYAQNTVSVAETLKQDHLTNVWDNPCTGEYIVNPNIKYRLKNKMKAMRIFRKHLNTSSNIVSNSLETVNKRMPDMMTADWTNKIADINDLPRFNKSKVQMKKWYSDIEVFTYMISEMSKKADSYKDQHPQDKFTYSDELRRLFKNSRQMLCTLQHTINDTIKNETKRPFTSKVTLEKIRSRLPRIIQDIESRERLHYFHFEYIFKSYNQYLKGMKKGVGAWLRKYKSIQQDVGSSQSTSSTSSLNLSDYSVSDGANISGSRSLSSTESIEMLSHMRQRSRTRKQKHQKH